MPEPAHTRLRLAACRVGHDTEARLNTVGPQALVAAAIDPPRRPPAIALIVLVIANILVAHLPSELASPILLVLLVRALKAVVLLRRRSIRRWLPPLALALLQAAVELTLVDVTVRPDVLTIPLRQAGRVLARVLVAVAEEICTVAISKAALPLALVTVSFQPGVDAVALGSVLFPCADIAVALDALPDAVPVLPAATELALVRLTVSPAVDALAVRLTLKVVALISVTRGVKLETVVLPLVTRPFALIDAARIVGHDTSTVALFGLSIYLSTIDAVLVLLYAKLAGSLPHLFVVELLADHLVPLDCVRLVLRDLSGFQFIFYCRHFLCT